jgi:hypothetical protein
MLIHIGGLGRKHIHKPDKIVGKEKQNKKQKDIFLSPTLKQTIKTITNRRHEHADVYKAMYLSQKVWYN